MSNSSDPLDFDLTAYDSLKVSTTEKKREWLDLPFWSAEQSAALSLGFDPEKIELTRASEGTTEYDYIIKRRLDVILEMQRKGRLKDTIRPDELIYCLESRGLPVEQTPGYVRKGEALEKITPDIPHDQSKDINPKEKESIYKIIIAMACVKYGYRPGSGRSDTAKRIQNDAKRIGLSITDDTIRGHLKAAAEVGEIDLTDL